MMWGKLNTISRTLRIGYWNRYALDRFFSMQSQPQKPSYYHQIGSHPLSYRTVGQQIARAADLFGDREAIVSCEQNVRYTFAEALEKADRLAAGYRTMGLKRGDAFGIWAQNSAEWYLNTLAAARAGMVMVAMNPAYQATEILHCLNKVGVKALFVNHKSKNRNYYDTLLAIIPELASSTDRVIHSNQLKHLKSIIVNGEEKLPGAYALAEVLRMADDGQISRIVEEQHLSQSDEPYNIQFTSGTTGTPKAVVLSHFNVVNHAQSFSTQLGLDAKAHRICVPNPLFHALGVIMEIIAGMHHGATLVLPTAGYDMKAALQAVEKERCSSFYGTPTMFVDLLNTQRQFNADVSSLDIAMSGGSSCPPTLFKNIKSELGLNAFYSTFGLTELSGPVFCSVPGEPADKANYSIGRLMDHMEAKVVDTEGRIVPMGQPGELYVRGYSTMLEYYGDPKATAETIGADKWLRTGDRFMMTDDGYGYVVGRIKDMIIRGGENISPKEIEDVLSTHPDVIECHVFGVPDDRFGEEVCVHIRTTEAGKHLKRKDFVKFCNGKLAFFKIPLYVRVVEIFPKTLSGKIQKRKLREEYDMADKELYL